MDEIKNKCWAEGNGGALIFSSRWSGKCICFWRTASKRETSNEQQAKLKGHAIGPSGEVDDLFVVMQRAYSEDPGSKFIRSIRAARDPAIVLAEDHQIADLVRFCTSSTEFGILTVDPTFSLGYFDVTPITYRHLLLSTKRNENTPVFLGPVLVHYFSTYLFFASSLVGLSSQLEGVRAFGTDGEKALSDAFAHEFGFSQRLTCFIHVRKNIKDKFSECCISSSLSQQILDDIFGQRLGGTFVEGIVDASDDSDFHSMLENCFQSWCSFETTSTCNFQKFIDYLVDNKASVICDTMLRSTRIECGLGCPPDIFTTNASESVNAILKRKVDYKKSELPEFISKVKEVIAEQQRELQRAIISRGGSVFMPGFGSPHFSMVQSPMQQSPMQQSPMNFYGPYAAQSMYPPYHQGALQEASNPLPTFPPYQYQPSVPFTLSFICGNISVCIGCKNKYPKAPKPPQDLCIRHEEWRQFTPPNSSSHPQSKFGNVYYHCRKECIWMRCPYFSSNDLLIPPDVVCRLTASHKEMLLSQFGLAV